MKVKVLFFGATADTVGERAVELEFEDPVDSGSAFCSILEEFPALAENHGRKSLLFSVNQEYSNGKETISDGDELAVFTAVSGG